MMRHTAVVLAIALTTSAMTIILAVALVGSSVRQRRRYLRTRDVLAGRLLTAHDEERAAIARDIHDDIVQRLEALAVRCQNADQKALSADQLSGEIRYIATCLRTFARGVHPALVDHLGLDAALRDVTASWNEMEDIAVEYSSDSDRDTLSVAHRLAFYRVAQEALGNVARHAGASAVRIGLTHNATRTDLSVEDDGVGFDPASTSGRRGLGIVSMRERMRLLGGELRIASTQGKGTRVVASLVRSRPAS